MIYPVVWSFERENHIKVDFPLPSLIIEGTVDRIWNCPTRFHDCEDVLNCPTCFHDCEDVLWIAQDFSMIVRMCWSSHMFFPLQDGSGYLWYALVHSQKTLAGDLGWLLKVQLNLLWFQWRYSPTSLKHLKTKSFARYICPRGAYNIHESNITTFRDLTLDEIHCSMGWWDLWCAKVRLWSGRDSNSHL